MTELKRDIARIKLAIAASHSLPADSLNKLTDEQIRTLEKELELLNAKAYSLSMTI